MLKEANEVGMLLDDLSKYLDCYISSLKYPNMKTLTFLTLNSFPIHQYTLEDWNETLTYLTEKDLSFSSLSEVSDYIQKLSR